MKTRGFGTPVIQDTLFSVSVLAACQELNAEMMRTSVTGAWPVEVETRGGSTMMKTRKWTTKDLGAPLRWRKPCHVEVPDLFDGSRSNEEIAAAFGVMAATPGCEFHLFTKYPDRAADWFGWIKYAYGNDRMCPAEGCRHEALERYPNSKHPDGRWVEAVHPFLGYDRRWPLPNVRVYFKVGGERVTVVESVTRPDYR